MRVPRVAYGHVAHSQVFAHQRVYVPCRRVFKRCVFQQHPLAAYEREQGRPQIVVQLLPRLVGVLAVGPLVVFVPVGVYVAYLFRWIPHVAFLVECPAFAQCLPLPIGHLAALHRSPALSVAVEHACAGDGYVLCVYGRQRRHAAAHPHPFKVRVYERVVGPVGREEHQGTLLKVQLGVAFQFYGPGEPHPSGHRQPSAAALCQGGNGLPESLGVHCGSVGHSSEVGEPYFIVGYFRYSNGPHLKGQVVVGGGCAVGLLCRGGQQRCQPHGGHSHHSRYSVHHCFLFFCLLCFQQSLIH